MNPFKFLVYLNDLREGDRRLIYLKYIERILEGDAEHIQKYQLDQLRNIFSYGYNNTEFYRNRFDQANVNPKAINSPNDLIKFPILEKDDIRNNQKSMLSAGVAKSDLVKTATGGTTSSPVPLFIDKESWAKRRAATLYFFKWFNYEIGDKMAYLWGAQQDISSNNSLKQKLRNILINRSLCLETFYLNDETMRSHYEKIVNFKPKGLQAYSTPLFLFANFLDKYKLKLNIKNINTSAEFLYDYQREKIEQVFNTKIFNWYGARELGHIATECSEHSGMHINVSGLFIEIIKNGKQVIDEEGEIVVTDLLNKAMPLIRYRLGDIGKISTRSCKCGSPLPILESVSGRLVDTFKKRDGSFVPGVAFPNRIINECKGIRELQIVQKDYQIFHLNIVRGEHYTNQDLDEIKQKICVFMHDIIEFEVHYLDKIPLEKSGKIRFCKSEIQ
jgi:phenylacetate-coenzyme A ligase PaaK-like adenylate-forming protein